MAMRNVLLSVLLFGQHLQAHEGMWLPTLLKGIEGDAVGKESYGIHGTIEPDSIGKNMSMGCIRLASDDINLLYDLLIEGKSQVKVVD